LLNQFSQTKRNTRLKASYLITQQDYLNGARLFTRLTQKKRIILVTLFLFMALLCVFADSLFKPVLAGGLIGMLIAIPLVRFVVNPIWLKRTYHNYAAIKEPQQIEFKEDGIQFSSADGSVLLRWKHIYQWRQNESYLLVYQNQRLYHIINKNIRDDGFELGKLIQCLSEKVGPES